MIETKYIDLMAYSNDFNERDILETLIEQNGEMKVLNFITHFEENGNNLDEFTGQQLFNYWEDWIERPN